VGGTRALHGTHGTPPDIQKGPSIVLLEAPSSLLFLCGACLVVVWFVADGPFFFILLSPPQKITVWSYLLLIFQL